MNVFLFVSYDERKIPSLTNNGIDLVLTELTGFSSNIVEYFPYAL